MDAVPFSDSQTRESQSSVEFLNTVQYEYPSAKSRYEKLTGKSNKVHVFTFVMYWHLFKTFALSTINAIEEMLSMAFTSETNEHHQWRSIFHKSPIMRRYGYLIVRLKKDPLSEYGFSPCKNGRYYVPICMLPFWYTRPRNAYNAFMTRLQKSGFMKGMSKELPPQIGWSFMLSFLIMTSPEARINDMMIDISRNEYKRSVATFRPTKNISTWKLLEVGDGRYNDLILMNSDLISAELRYRYKKRSFYPNNRKFKRALRTLEFLLQKHKQAVRASDDTVSMETAYYSLQPHITPEAKPQYNTPAEQTGGTTCSEPSDSATSGRDVAFDRTSAYENLLDQADNAGTHLRATNLNSVAYFSTVPPSRYETIVLNLWEPYVIQNTDFQLQDESMKVVYFSMTHLVTKSSADNLVAELANTYIPRYMVYWLHRMPQYNLFWRLLRLPYWLILANLGCVEMLLRGQRYYSYNLGVYYEIIDLLKCFQRTARRQINRCLFGIAEETSWSALNAILTMFVKASNTVGFRFTLADALAVSSRLNVWYHASKTRRGLYAVIYDLTVTLITHLRLDYDDFKGSMTWVYKGIGYFFSALHFPWVKDESSEDMSEDESEAVEELTSSMAEETSDGFFAKFLNGFFGTTTFADYHTARAYTAQSMAFRSLRTDFGFIVDLAKDALAFVKRLFSNEPEDVFQLRMKEWTNESVALVDTDPSKRDFNWARNVLVSYSTYLDLSKMVLHYNDPRGRGRILVPSNFNSLGSKIFDLKATAESIIHGVGAHSKAFVQWIPSVTAGLYKSTVSRQIEYFVLQCMDGKVDLSRIYAFTGKDNRPDGISSYCKILRFDDFAQLTNKEAIQAQIDNLRMASGFEPFIPDLSRLQDKGNIVISPWLVTVTSNHAVGAFKDEGIMKKEFEIRSSSAFNRRVDAFLELNWYGGQEDKWNVCPVFSSKIVPDAAWEHLHLRVWTFDVPSKTLQSKEMPWVEYLKFVISRIKKYQSFPSQETDVMSAKSKQWANRLGYGTAAQQTGSNEEESDSEDFDEAASDAGDVPSLVVQESSEDSFLAPEASAIHKEPVIDFPVVVPPPNPTKTVLPVQLSTSRADQIRLYLIDQFGWTWAPDTPEGDHVTADEMIDLYIIASAGEKDKTTIQLFLNLAYSSTETISKNPVTGKWESFKESARVTAAKLTDLTWLKRKVRQKKEENDNPRGFVMRKLLRAKLRLGEWFDLVELYSRLPFAGDRSFKMLSTVLLSSTSVAGFSAAFVSFFVFPWWFSVPFISSYIAINTLSWNWTPYEKEARTRRRHIFVLLFLLLIFFIVLYLGMQRSRELKEEQSKSLEKAVLDEDPEVRDRILKRASDTSREHGKRYNSRYNVRSPASETRDLNAEEKVQSLSSKSTFQLVVGSYTGTATYVNNGIFVTAAHNLALVGDDQFIKLRRGGAEYEIPWRSVETLVLRRNGVPYDIMFFKPPVQHGLVCRSLKKAFITEAELASMKAPASGHGIWGGRYATLVWQGKTSPGTLQIRDPSWRNQYMLETSGKEFRSTTYDRLWVGDGAAPHGSSGGIWIIHNTHLSHKLIGVQIATHFDRQESYAVPITFEDVCAAEKYFSPGDSRAEPTFAINGEEILENDLTKVKAHQWRELGELPESMVFLGFLKPGKAVYPPKRSEFYESPFQDPRMVERFGEERTTTQYGPATLGPGSDRYRNAKFARPMRCKISEKLLMKLAGDLAHMWPPPNPLLGSCIPLSQAKQAIPSTRMKGPHMTSSPGYPWCLERHNGKAPFARKDEDGVVHLSEKFLNFYIGSFFPYLATGLPAPEIQTDVSKDEILDPASLNKGKTRRFAPCSLHFWLAFQQLFGAWLDMIRSGSPAQGTTNMVGINVHGAHWNLTMKDILHRFERIGICAGDFSAFDVSVPQLILWVSIMTIIKYYSKYFKANPLLARHNAMRRSLAGAIVVTVRVLGSLLIAVIGGMSSGNPVTAELNGFGNELMHYSVFVVLADRLGVKSPRDLWHDEVRAAFYGDDSIVAVNIEKAAFYNQNSICLLMDELFGMTYTDAKKTGKILDYTPLEDVTFLKRYIREEDGLYFAPMEMVNLRQRTLWLRTSAGDHRKALRDNVDSAMRDIFQYGREKFEKELTIYNDMLSYLKINPVLLDFDELMEEYRATY